MTNSTICNDCICLPICISKANGVLIDDCEYMKNAINNICASLTDRDSTFILFKSLNRKFLMERIGLNLVIKGTQYISTKRNSNEMSVL